MATIAYGIHRLVMLIGLVSLREAPGPCIWVIIFVQTRADEPWDPQRLSCLQESAVSHVLMYQTVPSLCPQHL